MKKYCQQLPVQSPFAVDHMIKWILHVEIHITCRIILDQYQPSGLRPSGWYWCLGMIRHVIWISPCIIPYIAYCIGFLTISVVLFLIISLDFSFIVNYKSIIIIIKRLPKKEWFTTSNKLKKHVFILKKNMHKRVATAIPFRSASSFHVISNLLWYSFYTCHIMV